MISNKPLPIDAISSEGWPWLGASSEGGSLFSQHTSPRGDFCGLGHEGLKVAVNRTHVIIFHPLHQSLDLSCKFPERERRSVLFRNSARIFPPKGPVLEVSRAEPHCVSWRRPRGSETGAPCLFWRVITTNNPLKSPLTVCPNAVVKGPANHNCSSSSPF